MSNVVNSNIVEAEKLPDHTEGVRYEPGTVYSVNPYTVLVVNVDGNDPNRADFHFIPVEPPFIIKEGDTNTRKVKNPKAGKIARDAEGQIVANDDTGFQINEQISLYQDSPKSVHDRLEYILTNYSYSDDPAKINRPEFARLIKQLSSGSDPLQQSSDASKDSASRSFDMPVKGENDPIPESDRTLRISGNDVRQLQSLELLNTDTVYQAGQDFLVITADRSNIQDPQNDNGTIARIQKLHFNFYREAVGDEPESVSIISFEDEAGKRNLGELAQKIHYLKANELRIAGEEETTNFLTRAGVTSPTQEFLPEQANKNYLDAVNNLKQARKEDTNLFFDKPGILIGRTSSELALGFQLQDKENWYLFDVKSQQWQPAAPEKLASIKPLDANQDQKKKDSYYKDYVATFASQVDKSTLTEHQKARLYDDKEKKIALEKNESVVDILLDSKRTNPELSKNNTRLENEFNKVFGLSHFVRTGSLQSDTIQVKQELSGTVHHDIKQDVRLGWGSSQSNSDSGDGEKKMQFNSNSLVWIGAAVTAGIAMLTGNKREDPEDKRSWIEKNPVAAVSGLAAVTLAAIGMWKSGAFRQK